MSLDLADLYRDLHAHPELSFQETRTADLVAARLRASGLETTTGVGGTGVVGVVRNGPGPTVMLRADMDGLPVAEDTGLAYSSTSRGIDLDGREVPVMHACGHDVHVTALVGAAEQLVADRRTWSGTLVVVFQPAEELGRGARAMLDDGLLERFGAPDVVLGQHVAPLPAGMLALRAGAAFAGADSIKVTMHGRGAHGSRPETSVDPVVMAASTIMRLQTVVSREVAASETAVLTIGSVQAGATGNIIPEQAVLLLSLRTFDEQVRDRVLAAVRRIVQAEAVASGAEREPEVEVLDSFPAVVNHVGASARTQIGFDAAFGPGRVVDPGPVTGSEDVGLLATAAGAPIVYWLLGGADPELFGTAADVDGFMRVMRDLPSNHSPHFAPVIEPTLTMGVGALVSAARTWLAPVV
ncbi:amidohydrolase [Aeromicrobium stalagmiti]|uniref:amidohydrolase n=1 Tax=Aeromicrobium stalagmiti TaxID=2738988 RepID=UPI001568D15D|nr:amidohydrolase [Aeromicrobium stalagmiti]NRQ50378.1 amidohydrolase [Aeromicrobium stalagmiti]